MLVSTDWLAEHLDSPDIAIVDASWHLPAAKRDAKAEFLAARIPGAQFFDIDEISDTSSPLPHMLPTPEKFASRMRKLGIGDGKKVIVYDSARAFFGGPRLVDVPRLRPRRCGGARRRPAEMEGREPPARGRPAGKAAGTPFHRALPVHDGARQARCAHGRQDRCAHRSPMRARPAAFAARSRSRGPGCAPVTCPAPAISTTQRCSSPMAR